jgi:hypothetical protein
MAARSALEMATELAVARLGTYRLSFKQIVRMLQSTHAKEMIKKLKEQRVGQTTTASE